MMRLCHEFIHNMETEMKKVIVNGRPLSSFAAGIHLPRDYYQTRPEEFVKSMKTLFEEEEKLLESANKKVLSSEEVTLP